MNRFTPKISEFASLFRSPLSLRIISSIFISLAVIEGIMLIPSVQQRRQEILAQNAEVSSGKVKWILMTYPEAEGPELLAHLSDLGANPMLQTIVGGAVYDADGTRVGVFGEAPTLPFDEARQGLDRYFTPAQGHRYDAAWTTVQASGDEYALVLRHNATGTQTQLNFYILQVILTALVIAAFITLVMAVLLDRQLIRPILTLRRDLSAAGQAIATDNPAPQFDSCRFYRSDELGEVISTFRRMYEQIAQAVSDRKQAEAELREQNEQMRQYLEQVDQVTAAAVQVDNGTFNSESLDEVAARPDELGRLANMFQMMAVHLRQREEKLQQQLRELTIEIDQAKRQQDVAQITKSEYFQELQAEVDAYRAEEFWS